jgi:hypothetical protein
MTRDGVLSKKERTAMTRFVGGVINNIVPEYMKEDFLEHYTCCPPPIFMVVISIIEVSSFYMFYNIISKPALSLSVLKKK